MGGEFIKLMKKNPENSLKIFNMACLLTVARNNGYEQTVNSILVFGYSFLISHLRFTTLLKHPFWLLIKMQRN
jgi:hypothetical protein